MITGNMDGDKSQSEPWIGVTRVALLNEKPVREDLWVQVRLTKKRVTPGTSVQKYGQTCQKSSQRKAPKQMGWRETRCSTLRE